LKKILARVVSISADDEKTLKILELSRTENYIPFSATLKSKPFSALLQIPDEIKPGADVIIYEKMLKVGTFEAEQVMGILAKE
jgi:hypothetical protein